MRWRFLLSATAALTLAVPAATPASRPPRFLLAVASGGAVSLLQSSDGIRFAPATGVVRGTGTSPTPVRRGSTVYLYDAAGLAADVLGGPLRRFAVGSGGSLTEQAPTTYAIQLSSPADLQRASAGSFAPSVVEDDGGALVLLYALRYEPTTNACPVPGQACLKLRTATEVAGSGGTSFAGDPGNRILLSFSPADTVGPPFLLRAGKGWAVLLQGPGGCLHELTAADPHKAYRDAGCVSVQGPTSPSGLWDGRLREFRVYGVTAGAVVRAAGGDLRRLGPSRFRPLAAAGGRVTFARVAADTP